MRCLLAGVRIPGADGEGRRDLVFDNGRLQDPSEHPHGPLPVISGRDLHLFPGFTDVHVHLREPGFSYKETIASGTRSAARGGYTTVCAMPNLRPVPDSAAHLAEQLALINRDAVVRVLPYGAITVNQQGETLSDMDAMAPDVCGFSDDGKGVQNDALMEQAMVQAKRLNRVIAAHCEDDRLVCGGRAHDGAWAKANGIPGIPSESEWRQVQRDLALAEKTGCMYHVCHVSAKESVALIRNAKARGVNVTCETAPHYLLLNDTQLIDNGRFKMNPPIRDVDDQEALIAGLLDGTIDMIATDHAPHSADEKAGGFAGSLNGVVGLEVAFAALYTGLVRTGVLPLSRLLQAMVDAPNARFGITHKDDWTLFDLGAAYTVRGADFLSQGHATPFEGMRVYGECLLTIAGGHVAWRDPNVFSTPEEHA